jgi:rod shape-determining protein MreC
VSSVLSVFVMRAFSPQQVAFFAVVFVILFILLHLLGVLSFAVGMIKTGVYAVAVPMHRVGAGLSLSISGGECDCADALARQIEQLTIDNSKLRTLAVENVALKTALDFRESSDDVSVLARVAAESADITNRGLLIDRGSREGISIGQPVIVNDGVIIGKISSVSRNSATVLLLADSMSRLAVSLQGGSNVTGLLEGDRGLSMSISLIPQNEMVGLGEVVVTSGIESGIRRGLIVGIVDKVYKDEQEPFQTATVLPLSRSEHPVFVQVLIGSVKDNER